MTRYALIVDDDENNLEVLAQLLEVQDIKSVLVKDPSQTLEALNHLPRLDIVFLDLEMSKIDGYSLLTALRERIGNHAPIICCSVHLLEMDHARRAGFDGFIGKPLDLERFPEQIERIFSGRSVWELP